MKDAETHATELAQHFGQGESVLGTEKLVRYSLVAGERALAAYAWEDAHAYFQRGLAGRGIAPDDTLPAPLARRAESAPLPIEHQFTTPSDGFVSLVGR